MQILITAGQTVALTSDIKNRKQQEKLLLVIVLL